MSVQDGYLHQLERLAGNRPVLLTGAAGFIGYHVARQLLRNSFSVHGIDAITDYYDPQLKRARLEQLAGHKDFTCVEADLSEPVVAMDALLQSDARLVIHLAAQPGVRYSLENPRAYLTANIDGFLNVLEACRQHPVEHLVYASSSSVYGGNTKLPFSTSDPVDHPVSLYAATKKANELMAHTYSHLYDLPTTGLRFFTVYGPWGRPDMAYFKFVKAILAGESIPVYNHGDMRRDFTFIDDIVEGVLRVAAKLPSTESGVKARVYNIGHHTPVPLMEMIATLEKLLNRPAHCEMLPMQPGDIKETYADVDDLIADTGFSPSTDLETGLRAFVDWYQEFYG